MTTGTVLNPVDCMISVYVGHNLMNRQHSHSCFACGEIESQIANNLHSMKIIYILQK